MTTIYGLNMSYTIGTSEYNELLRDADMLPDLSEYQEMMFETTMERINEYDETQGNCELFDYYIAIRDHIIFDEGVLSVPKTNQPLQKLLSLYHPKTIQKQEQQNMFYINNFNQDLLVRKV